jgi:carbamoyltransferase
MTILGIGGILRDTACAVLKDGKLVAAIEQAKVARHEVSRHLPEETIAACLSLAKSTAAEVTCVAMVRPLDHDAERSLHLHVRSRFPNARVVLVEHHTAHAASAYYTSPFDNATVLTLDRMGDFRCGALWNASGTHLDLEREASYPDSPADLYSRTTSLVGFKPNADEHKLQWLSTLGDNRYVELFDEILGAANSAWPQVDRTFFHGDRIRHGGFSAKMYSRLGLEDGDIIPESLKPAIAAGVQRAVEKAALRMAGSGENLCLGGGLALNVLLVAAMENSGAWKNVYVQPAAGNAGTAIGAVLHAWHNVFHETARASIGNLCLGPEFGAEDIKQVLENCKLRFRYLLTSEDLIQTAVSQLMDNKIVAWMQGPMEFGPRALGNRSILASPRDPYSSENLNLYIKHREPFRKFAASVPEELASEYFQVGPNARYIATVGRVREAHRKTLEPAILGEDLVRVHLVSQEDHPVFWRLLHAAGESSGLPVLYNTSFNLFGDPLVCTPRDAVRSFYSSGIDSMFVGHFLLEK